MSGTPDFGSSRAFGLVVTMKKNSSPAARTREMQSRRRTRSAATHLSCFVLGIVVTAAIGWLVVPHGHSTSSRHAAAPAITKSASAPWGEIEYTAIDLERPDESFGDGSLPIPPTTWFFGNCSEEQVAKVVRAGDLTDEQQRLLNNRSRWHAATNGWMLLPPPEVIRTLSPKARARIYSILRQYPENPLHQNPAHFAVTEFDDWLAQCGLPEDKRVLLRSLTYREGDQVLFADFEFMESQCSRQERRQLAKAISQSPCLLMCIRVRPDTDVDALLRYWGRGGRGKAMRPFVESLTRVPEGGTIGISFFFPEYARARLYTYPDPATDRAAAREDCFFTALNFFNDRPDPRLFDPEFFRATLERDYTRVSTNWLFGDLLAVLDPAGVPRHMCVYIADDVVFTKNGLDTIEPWRLVKLAQMLKTYAPTGTEHLTGFRRKEPAHL